MIHRIEMKKENFTAVSTSVFEKRKKIQYCALQRIQMVMRPIPMRKSIIFPSITERFT